MRSKFFQFISTLGLQHLLRIYKTGKLTVLCLHRISDENDYFFPPLKPEIFDQLLKYATKFYQITTFQESLTIVSKKPLLIFSFDDGYYDFIEFGLPLLHKYHLPSNHNLINACLNGNFTMWTQRLNQVFNFLRNNHIINDPTLMLSSKGLIKGKNWHDGYLLVFRTMLELSMQNKIAMLEDLEKRYSIDTNCRMMNWAEAQTLPGFNVEVGSHTYNHDSLNQVTDLPTLNREILDSKNELSSKLKQEIDIIAFPNGQYNNIVIDYCKQVGFSFCLLIGDSLTPVKTLMLNNSSSISINRIGINNEPFQEIMLRVELFHSLVSFFSNKIRT